MREERDVMLRVIGSLGDHPRRHSTDAEVVGRVHTAFEQRTETMLRVLYVRVADHLAGTFARMRDLARAQVDVLVKLADVGDLTVPEPIEAEIRQLAARVAWRPMARASVLGLFEAAKALARPLDETEPMTTDEWVRACLDELNREDFTEDTGLEGSEIALAIHQTAISILGWAELDTHMPMFFRGLYLTLGRTTGGVVIARGDPLVLISESGQVESDDAIPSMFSRFQPDFGVAALASEPMKEVAVVGAADGGFFTDTTLHDLCATASGSAGRRPLIALPWAKEDRSRRFEPIAARAGRSLELHGAVVWDPASVVVQTFNGAVLFKPKIDENCLPLGRWSEGFLRCVEVAKHSPLDFKQTTLVVD